MKKNIIGRILKVAVALVPVIVLALASNCFGSIQILATPPADVSEGALESDTLIYGFQESTGHTNDQLVDHIATSSAATIDQTSDLVGGTVTDDFDSWLFHFDRVGDSPNQPFTAVSGEVTFTGDILGVIVVSNSLYASDGDLGAAGTTYPVNVGSDAGFRGLELNNQDSITVSFLNDQHTIRFDILQTGHVIDHVRVLTETGATVVPEPSSCLTLAGLISCFGLAGWRRRRRNQSV